MEARGYQQGRARRHWQDPWDPWSRGDWIAFSGARAVVPHEGDLPLPESESQCSELLRVLRERGGDVGTDRCAECACPVEAGHRWPCRRGVDQKAQA